MSLENRIKKLEEKVFGNQDSQNQEEFITIGYDQIPKEIFEKYGAKPFQIAKRKFRKDGKTVNNVNYFEARKLAEEAGCRLPKIQEMLVLLDYYKFKNKEVSNKDKEFLGIEELSYDEDVYYEWVEMTDKIAFLRGGNWSDTTFAGVFTLYLSDLPTAASNGLGFRCARQL